MVDKKFDVFFNMEAKNEERLQVYIGSILMPLDDVSSQDKPQPAVRALEYRINQSADRLMYWRAVCVFII